MRGAPCGQNKALTKTGIIPAYAGSTKPRDAALVDKEDHPRVCGEHYPARPLYRRGLGSSPRMRGAPTCAAICTRDLRIIPAYAGSTSTNDDFGTAFEDHPRVCGEHSR